jgi:hypothetical protein
MILHKYDRSRYIPYNGDIDDYDELSSSFLRKLRNLPASGYITVTEDKKDLDLLAYQIYGVELMWWIIADYNGISDPFSLIAGQRLLYPSISSLESLRVELRDEIK